MLKLLTALLPPIGPSLKGWLKYGLVMAFVLALGFAGVKVSNYFDSHLWITKSELTTLKDANTRLIQDQATLTDENRALRQSVVTLTDNVKVLQDTVREADERMQRQLVIIAQVERTAKAMQVKMTKMQTEAAQQIQELRAQPELSEDQLMQLERRVRYQLLSDLAECANAPHAASCLESLK